CSRLKVLPEIVLEEHFREELARVKADATESNNQEVLSWLQNKEGKNAWVLHCVSPATSRMKKDDWYSTSHSTNIAESAHAHSQRDGTRLTLVSAIQIARQLDERFLEGQK